MFNRSAAKAFGLLLLVPSVILGITPLLAEHTVLLDYFGEFTLSLGSFEFLSVTQSAVGAGADVSPWVWLPAVVGEVILISVQIWSPPRPSRFRINIR